MCAKGSITSVHNGSNNEVYGCATQVGYIDEHDNDNNDVLDQVDAHGKW